MVPKAKPSRIIAGVLAFLLKGQLRLEPQGSGDLFLEGVFLIPLRICTHFLYITLAPSLLPTHFVELGDLLDTVLQATPIAVLQPPQSHRKLTPPLLSG